MTVMESETLARTRRSLHGIAELVLAGPQHRASGRIRLRITPGGFGTVAEPALTVEGDHVVAGTARFPLAGRSYTQVAAAVGVEVGAPDGLYPDGAGVSPEDVITLDAEATRVITRAFADGERALRQFAPEAEPVLWPEHFDLAITVDEINYGVSPGDSHLPQPYAYVGPHRPRLGSFWNASFGATRPLHELGDADRILQFFREGRRSASS
jgi:hypothetical protein